MRKIKFRMWNPLGRDGRGRYHYGKQAMECLTQQSIGLYDHEKDGCIFEQFTGLRDKNGEEIYEGDIVYIAGRGNCLVLWSWSCLSFNFVHNGFSEDFQDILEDIDSLKVVGNMHENP